uniref:Uncharacterized protein n=1 Tax=viral metagenome TaxID=1070528 RepID=A0A6C0DPM1_9ZZZZ
MALALGNDPCSMLNMNVQVGTTPMFAPSSSANATMLSKFVKKGVLISLKDFLTPFNPSSLNVPMLTSIPKDTNPRLLNFLSGKGLAKEAYEVLGIDFRMMSNCLLRPLDINSGGSGGFPGSTGGSTGSMGTGLPEGIYLSNSVNCNPLSTEGRGFGFGGVRSYRLSDGRSVCTVFGMGSGFQPTLNTPDQEAFLKNMGAVSISGPGSTMIQGFANRDPRAGIQCGGGTGSGSSLPMCEGPSGPVPVASYSVMTIVDDYIMPQVGGNYTWSESGSSALSANSIWNPSDQKTDQTFGIVMNPTSIVGKLIRDGFLLSGEELYSPSTGIGNAPPQEGSESLFYFYKMAQTQNVLTMTQKQRKVTIECKNMRFFAAYILEYCYYKSRYDFFLSLYFSIFTESNYSPVSQSTLDSLFTGPGTGTSEYNSTDGFISQDEYLKGIAYHMACLNTRMNDMRSILNYINNYYTGILNAYQERLNSMGEIGSTNEVESKILALQQSADDAQEYLSQADFRKGVMEYNSEKNRYANVLLGLYAFLNISALAVIFHVMRS